MFDLCRVHHAHPDHRDHRDHRGRDGPSTGRSCAHAHQNYQNPRIGGPVCHRSCSGCADRRPTGGFVLRLCSRRDRACRDRPFDGAPTTCWSSPADGHRTTRRATSDDPRTDCQATYGRCPTARRCATTGRTDRSGRHRARQHCGRHHHGRQHRRQRVYAIEDDCRAA